MYYLIPFIMFQLFRPDQEKVSEIFLLVHPLGREFHIDHEKMVGHYKIWMQALKEFSQNPECYGMIALQDQHPWRYESEEQQLQKLAQKSFRNRLFMKRSGSWFGDAFFDDKTLESRIDLNEVRLTASGLYTELCVLEAIGVISKRYDIPHEQITIDLKLSIDSGDLPELKDLRLINHLVPYLHVEEMFNQRY